MKLRMLALLAGIMLFALGCGGGASSSGGSVRSILFLAQVKSYGETSDVFIANGDGTNVRQFTHLTNTQTANDACFSPDGKTVLYTLYNLPTASLTNAQLTVSSLDIHVVNTDGANDHLFVKDQTLQGLTASPRYNSNGTKALFVGRSSIPASMPVNANDPNPLGVYTTNPDGSGSQRLGDAAFQGGLLFVYTYYADAGLRANEDALLHSFYPLANPPAEGSSIVVSNVETTPWWSYNAATNRVVYTALAANSGYALYISDPQRAHPTVIAPAYGNDNSIGEPFLSSPHFSRDGRKIVFTGLNAAGQAAGANPSAVCIINADGSGLTQLTHSGDFVEFQDLY